MTKGMPSTALMLGWMIVIACAAAARGDDEKTSALETVLTDKGLVKDDRKFLLGEKAVIEKYDQAKSAQDDYQRARKRAATIAEFDENVQAMEVQKQALQQQIDAIQAQINSMGQGYGRMRTMMNQQQAPMRQQQTQNRATINQINAQIQASKTQGPKPAERKSATAELERARSASAESLRELKEEVEPLLAKYHELGLDQSVSDALLQLRHLTTKNYKLGPSEEAAAAAKLVHEGKKSTAAKAKPIVKKKAKTKSL